MAANNKSDLDLARASNTGFGTDRTDSTAADQKAVLHENPYHRGLTRWHDGSLSVGGRRGSVAEASVIRIAALPFILQAIAPTWELPIRRAILKAGDRLNLRST